MKKNVKRIGIYCFLIMICIGGNLAFAEDATTASNARSVDLVWMLMAAFLVFFMQPGFAMVDAGFQIFSTE